MKKIVIFLAKVHICLYKMPKRVKKNIKKINIFVFGNKCLKKSLKREKNKHGNFLHVV